eukprot:12408525-Karenia_brevis.AAC.1
MRPSQRARRFSSVVEHHWRYESVISFNAAISTCMGFGIGNRHVHRYVISFNAAISALKVSQ